MMEPSPSRNRKFTLVQELIKAHAQEAQPMNMLWAVEHLDDTEHDHYNVE